MTTGEIAARLNAAIEGDSSRIIRRLATLDLADDQSISWLGDERRAAAARTRAAAVVIGPKIAAPSGTTAIRVADPDLAMCEIAVWLAPPMERVAEGVHASAVIAADAAVAPSAAIGPNVVIGPRARIAERVQLHAGVFIGADSRIGEDSVLWPHAVVRERCTLGARVIVHANATIGADGFGFLFRDGRHVKIPQVGTVEVGDDVEIGAGSCIDRGRNGATRVGRGTKIDNLVQIGHNCQIGEHCMIVAQVGVSGSCTLGRYVVLAGQVGVADHVRIGDGAKITGQTGVARDVPERGVFGGTPAVEQSRNMRNFALLQRLPELWDQLRRLARRVEEIESAANHQKPG